MLQGTIDALGQIRVPNRKELVRMLGWQPHGYVEASLASGSAALRLFLGEVVFDGRRPQGWL